ncbi:MAG TPA: hypothetical protein VGF67_02290 [Ktedonobacteraceae bacterium]|jgi:hypothetical protein
MASFHNPQTDALKLVHTETIQRGWFAPPPTLNAEEGFTLEHYRGNTHINTYSSAQSPSARRPADTKDGDSIFRLNLGPRSLLIQSNLLTWEERYQRPYSLVVDIQIRQPSQFLTLYRQEADPVALVARAITEAIQKYAGRTIYEDMHPFNLVARVQSIFDNEPQRCKAGIAIVEVHDPVLGPAPNYQPVKIRQILPLRGNISSRDTYTRSYEVQVELEVVDIYGYKQHEREGEHPLNLVQTLLDDELQRTARELFYEEQNETQLQTYLETQAFADFPGQRRAGMKIVRAYNFRLGPDARYKPVAKIQRLTLTGTLKTLEKYERPYSVSVELQVSNLHNYLRRTNENTAPVDLAQAAIEGKILQFAASQSYESLSNKDLRQLVVHAFDTLDGREVGGLQIKVVHFFDLKDARAYKTVQVLEIAGVINTADLLHCPYTLTVELKIGDAATFVQLTSENIDPLHLVKEAIAGEIVKLTRGKPHDDVIKLDLTEAALQAFEQQTPHTMIAGLRLAKAHHAQIQVDENIRARAEIVQVKETELTQIEAKKAVLKQTQDADAELKQTAEEHNLDLTIKKGHTAEAQLNFDLKRDQMIAMSQGYTEFFQKVMQIEIENLETGSSTHTQVWQNIQNMIQSTLGYAPQIAGQAQTNEQHQLQEGQPEVRALKAGQPSEDAVQVIEAAQPAKKAWPEAGLILMVAPVPSALLPYMEGITHAFQVQKIEAESPARKAGIRKGDFLVGIEEEDTYTADDFDKACASITSQTSVLVYIRRAGALEDYTLHFAQDETEDSAQRKGPPYA